MMGSVCALIVGSWTHTTAFGEDQGPRAKVSPPLGLTMTQWSGVPHVIAAVASLTATRSVQSMTRKGTVIFAMILRRTSDNALGAVAMGTKKGTMTTVNCVYNSCAHLCLSKKKTKYGKSLTKRIYNEQSRGWKKECIVLIVFRTLTGFQVVMSSLLSLPNNSTFSLRRRGRHDHFSRRLLQQVKTKLAKIDQSHQRLLIRRTLLWWARHRHRRSSIN